MQRHTNNQISHLWPLKSGLRKHGFTLYFVLLLCLSPLSAAAQDWIYTTRPGDTLWDISKKHLKSVTYWSRLQRHNSINTAKRMAPGTRLLIPIAWLKRAPAPATVLSASGDVSYVSAKDGTITKLGNDKKTLLVGDKLLTGQDGSVTIEFADGSTLLLQKQSELILDTLSAYGSNGMLDTQIRLQRGRLETSVNPKKRPSSRYKITTPAAVAAVRGTTFRVGYESKDSTMLSEVVNGNIGVEATGVIQVIPKGYGTVAEEGSPPIPPKALLAAPDIAKLPGKILHLPYTMTWPALAQAAAYRIQVSPIQSSPVLIVDERINQPQYTLDQLKSGQYQLIIRGIDNINLEGFNARHSFEISTDFPTVKLLAPHNTTPVYNGKVNFKWNKPGKVTRFHLQVSPDKTFESISIDKITKGTRFISTEAFAPGEYAWRIAGIDADGNEGAFSTATMFTVKPLPSPPQIDLSIDNAETEQGNIDMHWQAVAETKEYVIQVAKDADFNDIIINETTTTTQYTPTTALPYGSYYYRAKSVIDADIHGEYSNIKEFDVVEDNSLVFWLWLLLVPFML